MTQHHGATQCHVLRVITTYHRIFDIEFIIGEFGFHLAKCTDATFGQIRRQHIVGRNLIHEHWRGLIMNVGLSIHE